MVHVDGARRDGAAMLWNARAVLAVKKRDLWYRKSSEIVLTNLVSGIVICERDSKTPNIYVLLTLKPQNRTYM